MARSASAGPRKLCFVTIGATATFDALLRAVLEDRFLNALTAAGYTHLRLQCGKSKALVEKLLEEQSQSGSSPRQLEIDALDFRPDGLRKDMVDARGGKRDELEGVCISHAGSGTILDAFAVRTPLIVVPNTSLLDNHQVELAEALQKLGYLIHGDLNNLSAAIQQLESIRTDRLDWPHRRGAPDMPQANVAEILDEEMGYVD